MRIEGEVRFEFAHEKTARIVAELLEIDNRVAPRGMRISTGFKGKSAVTRLEYGRLNTFFATLDDLVFSERIVESILEKLGE